MATPLADLLPEGAEAIRLARLPEARGPCQGSPPLAEPKLDLRVDAATARAYEVAAATTSRSSTSMAANALTSSPSTR